ncbi:hypothetical protein BAE44_0011026 [Dichanthelium oligosanthes]|uniref:Uncharacterized protein n=1 Tax=Dichanthelium oligosanthes TaxID=888268 RepID=A0A1E5VS64_9POAL|nr:hypothetical protein BAE44_0011026 [Dichanthelium oligosanthes]
MEAALGVGGVEGQNAGGQGLAVPSSWFPSHPASAAAGPSVNPWTVSFCCCNMSRYHLKQYEKEHMKMAMLRQEETFKQQVQELHRLYRVQKLLMTDAASATMPVAAARCNLEDERRAAENDAGSSKSWDDAYPEQGTKAAHPQLVLQESELELTLSLGCFGTPGGKKAASSSVDSRTSVSSSSTESGSPDRRAVRPAAPSSLIGSAAAKPGAGGVGQRLVEQEGLQQPPWLHKCLNLAR